MKKSPLSLWFVTGSQHLYGEAALRKVAANAQHIAEALSSDPQMPLSVLFKPVVTTPAEIAALCSQANEDTDCAGLITWMHTFSPAKMWIGGLRHLSKPLCHLHTQFNRDIPWAEIDMDFMNLNQSAHGCREYGHLLTRMRIARTVIAGHWEQPAVRHRLAEWARVAMGWAEWQRLKVVRFGDNMREVAVTEGDKVEAQRVFGFSVNTHGVGDLVAAVRAVSDQRVEALCQEYEELYEVQECLRRGGSRHESLREAARIECGLRDFLEAGGYRAFTDTFEDLHGLRQLPGIAVQRLMADGYGFGAEGDWKHAALVRALKAMADGLPGGTSFMEDYTYHFDPSGPACLGAHMLEICPSIAAGRPRCEIHPLGIGGKEDPVRLVFDAQTGPALNVSLVDLGNRFRLVVNEVTSIPLPQPMPKLPVARVLWKPLPDLATAAEAWIHAGGAHHTAFCMAVTTRQIEQLAEMAGVECVVIDGSTTLRQHAQNLRLGEVYYGLRSML